MKKNVFFFLLLAVTLVACHHYNRENGEVKKFETRNITGFTAIDVSNAIEVNFTQANEDKVSVGSNNEKFNKNIITEVKNGILKIYIETGFWDIFNDIKVVVNVSTKSIDMIDISGASTVHINEFIIGNNLKLSTSGASRIDGNIKVQDLSIAASGASTINLYGNSNNVTLSAKGASTIANENLKTEKYNIDLSGASTAKLYASQEITGEASGASTIHYSGNAANIKVETSGASTVEKVSL